VSQLIARAALASEASGQRGQASNDSAVQHDRYDLAAALEIALAVLVLGMAAWTIAARETFAAVVGFVAYGLLLALVWVRLDAVDVAIDRSRDRRPERHPAGGRGRPPARQRDAGGGGVAHW
jgi:uncharacterized MnhB-related membrane protein